MIHLILPMPPSLNRLYRTCRSVVYKTDEARTFEQLVKFEGRDCTPFNGAVALTVVLYRPTRTGDIDNYSKLLLDALQGVIYDNDKQVCDLRNIKAHDKHNPRVEVYAREVDLNSFWYSPLDVALLLQGEKVE